MGESQGTFSLLILFLGGDNMLAQPVGSLGNGDMLKSIYDTDEDGVVDETEKVDGGIFV